MESTQEFHLSMVAIGLGLLGALITGFILTRNKGEFNE